MREGLEWGHLEWGPQSQAEVEGTVLERLEPWNILKGWGQAVDP